MNRPWKAAYRRCVVSLEVTRYGHCERCGMALTDHSLGHGFLGGPFCYGKPVGPWHWTIGAYVGGRALDLATLPQDLRQRLVGLERRAHEDNETTYIHMQPRRPRATRRA